MSAEKLGWAVTMIGLPVTLLALVGVLVWWFVTSIGG